MSDLALASNRPALRTSAIVLLLAAGIFAGAQLGKIAPLVGWYGDELGFSLVYVGWLTSTIGVFVALAALPASLVIDRLGLFRMLAAGSAALAAGGLALSAVDDPRAVLFARAVEGAGYLVLVIAIPAILNAIAPPAQKAPVLAIWGGFVPVGFAVADFLNAGMADGPPQRFLFVIAAIFAVLALAATFVLLRVGDASIAPAADAETPRAAASLSPGVWLVSASFGFYVVLSIAFFAFLPAAAARDGGSLAAPAGLVALLVPFGNAIASIGMAGRGANAAVILAAAGFAVSAGSALPAFMAGDPVVATVAAIVFAVSGGVTASALFASVPFIVPRGGSASVVIGMICQAGGLTTLLGPPLAAAVIESSGWDGFAWFLAAMSLVGLALIVPVYRTR